MNRLILTLILLVACVSLWSILLTTQEADVASGTVRGQIVDITPQQTPIGDVRVTLTRLEPDFETPTNANGEYELTNLPPGRYLISIDREGYGERIGKLVTVVNGGDPYVPLKKDTATGLENLLQLLMAEITTSHSR